jgi:O-antigen ligase
MPSFDREAIAFQLAGLVSLAVLSMTFPSVKLNKGDLQRLFLAMIAPTLAMGCLIAYISLTQDISYSGGSANEQVTGGIGANQVTSALSLGALAAFYYIFLTGKDRLSRFLMIGLMISLVALSVLTFSRAGLWNTAGAVAVAALIILRKRSQGINLVVVALIIGLISYYVVLPFLTSLTGGALGIRFSDFDTTDRDILVKIDYQVFLDHPVFGVGVGQSLPYHIPIFGYPKNTHTEYGRLLAEHGSFGVAMILILVGVAFSRLFSRRSPLSKSIAVGFTIWALLYMTHAATRLVAPSFAFGLAAACFLPEEEEAEA